MNVQTNRQRYRQTDRQNLQIACICGANSGSPQLTLVIDGRVIPTLALRKLSNY